MERVFSFLEMHINTHTTLTLPTSRQGGFPSTGRPVEDRLALTREVKEEASRQRTRSRDGQRELQFTLNLDGLRTKPKAARTAKESGFVIRLLDGSPKTHDSN